MKASIKKDNKVNNKVDNKINSNVTLCKNCKWYQKYEYSGDCVHPSNYEFDYITGNTKLKWSGCYNNGRCKNFEEATTSNLYFSYNAL